MKKSILFLFILFVSLSIFVSCSHDTPQSNDLSGDVRDMTGKWFDVNDKTSISLKNIPDDVLYSIQVNNSSKGISSRGDGPSNSKLAKTQDDSIIPIVDENGSCSFLGKDVDIPSSGGQLRINEIKSNTTGDRMILSSLDPSQSCSGKGDRYEEYYEAFHHVNLNSAKYKSLDRSNIAIIHKENAGGGSVSMSSDCGIFYTNHFALSDTKEIKSLLDLSAISKFNLYQGIGLTKDDDTAWRQFEFVITNPVELGYGSKTTITSSDNVFKVAKATDQSKEYVIELESPSETVVRDVYQNMFSNADARYLDGTRKAYFAPMTNDKSNIATYYLGKIDDVFMFNVCWTGDEDTQSYGSVTLREITPEEKANIVFIDGTSTDYSIPNNVHYKLFVVKPNLQVSSVEFENLSGANLLNLYYVSGHLNGLGSSGRGGDSASKQTIRSDDVLEYFYVRGIHGRDGDVSGTVKCECPIVLTLQGLSGEYTFLMANGNAPIPIEAELFIKPHNESGTWINRSHSLIQNYSSPTDVTITYYGEDDCDVTTEIVEENGSKIVYIKFNYSIANYGTLLIHYNYPQTLDYSKGNNGIGLSKVLGKDKYDTFGGIELTNDKSDKAIILPAGSYTLKRRSWGEDRNKYELHAYPIDFTITEGSTTEVTIVSE